MYVEYIYGLVSLILFGLASIVHPVISVALTWVGVSLFIVFIAYLTKQPRIFRKRSDGSIPSLMRVLFFPFMFGVQLYNKIEKARDVKSNRHYIHHISDDIYLGSRLDAEEAMTLDQDQIGAVLDVTAEFDALDWSTHYLDIDYLNIPILDHQSPTKAQLRQALNWMDSKRREGKPVLVHCALGRGRSLFCVAAYLLALHPDKTPREVLESITDIRSQAGLNKHQLKQLVKYREQNQITLQSRAWLIANPVSGQGKWEQYKNEIISTLGQKYNLNIVETSPQTSAQDLAKRAVQQNASTIIAAGGDGTLTEVASVVVNTDTSFGIMPLGTANALAHTLYGVESKVIPIQTALDHILSEQIQRIDTASCNGDTMLLVAAVGIEEQMIRKADREAKNKLGQFAYLHGFWQALQENKTLSLMVQFDDEPAQRIYTTSLVVANAAPLTTLLAQGRGEPNYQDGLLNITWLNPAEQPFDQVYDIASLLAAGFSDDTNNTINTRTAKRVRIKSETEIGYVIDGETFASSLISVSSKPASLNVLLASNSTK